MSDMFPVEIVHGPCHSVSQADYEKVKAEVDDWREAAKKVAEEPCSPPTQQHCTCVALLRKNLATLTSDLKAAREALRKYGKHIGNGTFQCVVDSNRATFYCLCGLDAALKAALKENGDVSM